MPRYRQYDDDATSPYEAEPVDAEEEAYKRAGLAASNEAMKKTPKQGILESLGRLFEGSIDQPGSAAYEKYGAGLGRALANNPNYSNEGRGRTQAPAPVARTPVDRAPSEMPAYSGRVANRLADIQSENAPLENVEPRRYPASSMTDKTGKKYDLRDDPTAYSAQNTLNRALNNKTPARAPIVTKEELAASGMSLRDYLNKQQGLTRRKETDSTKRPTRPGQDMPAYSNEGRRSSMTKGVAVSRPSNKIAQAMGVNSNTLLPTRMAAGGTASSRADGIAQRGKTKGKFC